MEHGTWNKILKVLRTLSIFLVFGAMVSGLWFFMNPFSNTQTVYTVLPDTDCQFINSTQSEKTVVLRVDDIQAYTWRETSMKMIHDAASRNIPLTLGVIPVGIIEDVELVTFLKNHKCQVEFALHGLTHNAEKGVDAPEFGAYTKDEALSKITAGQRLLAAITSDPIVSWIPPLNIQSDGTIEALGELGFTHISAEGQESFDYDASTYRYGENTLVSTDDVVNLCRKAFETSQHCVIMLHPQDFATGLDHDEKKYQEYYLELLDALEKEGVTFSRLKDLPL